MIFFPWLLFGFLISVIFKSWFCFGVLSSGDWPYLFLENIKQFSFLPISLPQRGILWLAPYYQISSKIFVQYLGFSWGLAEKLFWFWPFLLLSIFSSYYLTRSKIGVLIYTTNTYILMLVGGGQMGVALSYSIAPLVLAKFINLINSSINQLRKTRNSQFAVHNSKIIKNCLTAGLVLSLEVMFDPRIAYITIIAIGIYLLMQFFNFAITGCELRIGNVIRKLFNLLIYSLIIPIIIVLSLHAFWILPIIMSGSAGIGSLGEVYTSIGAVKFFSFASFSNTISLLHPNWPENIFGKVYFMRWQFLLLPILAYGALLFNNFSIASCQLRVKNNLRKKFNTQFTIRNSLIVPYFVILGLIGAFLAKGANPPFGGIYLLLFKYFPGFIMFRDPTKFYVLIALSYSVLIPFFIKQLINYLIAKKWQKFYGQKFNH